MLWSQDWKLRDLRASQAEFLNRPGHCLRGSKQLSSSEGVVLSGSAEGGC